MHPSRLNSASLSTHCPCIFTETIDEILSPLKELNTVVVSSLQREELTGAYLGMNI